jgi:hypothetical protein
MGGQAFCLILRWELGLKEENVELLGVDVVVQPLSPPSPITTTNEPKNLTQKTKITSDYASDLITKLFIN